MTAPFISVVMAAHNVAAYIETAIQSVLTQTGVSFELIVVDDASSDDTPTRLAAYDDPRLIVLRSQENEGVSMTRNRALGRARGTWIAIVDADDWIAPGRLRQLAQAADDLGADWIADDQYFVRDGLRHPCARLLAGEPPGARQVPIEHIVAQDPPDYMGYGLLKPVFRRTLLERTGLCYRPELRRYEDFLLLIELAAHGARLALLNEPLYFYRLRAGSLTKLDPRRVMDEMLAVSAFARQAAAVAHDDRLLDALSRREALIERGRRYYAFAMPFKAGKRLKALGGLAREPALVPHVAQKLTTKLTARLRRLDPLAEVLLGGAGSLIDTPDQRAATACADRPASNAPIASPSVSPAGSPSTARMVGAKSTDRTG